MAILGMGRNRQYEAGIKYYDHGQFELAIKEFNQVLASTSDPESGEAKLARFYLGEAHATLAENHLLRQTWVGAEEHLLQAIKINPNYPDLRYQLAQVYFLTERLAEAATQIGESIRLNPRYANALFLDGVIRYAQGFREPGIKRMFEAITVEQSFRCPDLEMALAKDNDNDTEGALELFTSVAKLKTDEVGGLVKDAKEQLRMGDLEAAERSATDAVRIHPDYPDVRNLMGQVYLAKGEHLRAVNEFKAALMMNPEYVAALINLGKVCAQMNNPDAARDALKKALKLDPANEEAKKALSTL
jgi:tetratricopeptide (TPR) repeat protein